jgi:drug/metabolite transporter (DMT)-like permease
MKRPIFLIRALAVAVVGFNVSGNYFLSVGMRSMGELVSVSPLDYLRALANGWVVLGIVLLMGWLISQLSLLSWADLTFVLPITAISYVITAVLGAVSLKEHVSDIHWVGVLLIFAGVVIVGRTRPRTAPVPPATQVNPLEERRP